jgi:hypothetical protein
MELVPFAWVGAELELITCYNRHPNFIITKQQSTHISLSSLLIVDGIFCAVILSSICLQRQQRTDGRAETPIERYFYICLSRMKSYQYNHINKRMVQHNWCTHIVH